MTASKFRILRVCSKCISRPFSSLRITPPARPSLPISRVSSFHSSSSLESRKRNDYFSSKAPGQQQPDIKTEEAATGPKKKSTRLPTVKNSLRRVAVEAQRSRDDKEPRKPYVSSHQTVARVRACGYHSNRILLNREII